MERRGGFEKRADGFIQIRIVRAPNQVAAADAARIDGAVAESQLQLALAHRHFEDAAALFRLLRAAPIGSVEDYAIAWLEGGEAVRRGGRRNGFDHYVAIGDARYAAHQYPAMPRRAAILHRLMIGSG